MLDGDLVLGPVTGTYYCLFQNEISNISTVTPSLFNQTRRITRHSVSITRYKTAMTEKLKENVGGLLGGGGGKGYVGPPPSKIIGGPGSPPPPGPLLPTPML